jgi:hypothetical protein
MRTVLWEAAMPSPVTDKPASRQGFWPAIVRIFLVEVVLLLALSGAVVGYLNWSSEAAWAEFVAASKQSTSEAKSAVQTVKGHVHCDRNA